MPQMTMSSLSLSATFPILPLPSPLLVPLRSHFPHVIACVLYNGHSSTNLEISDIVPYYSWLCELSQSFFKVLKVTSFIIYSVDLMDLK